MDTIPVQVRIDVDFKSEATALFNSLGLDMSSAVNLFLHQGKQLDEKFAPCGHQTLYGAVIPNKPEIGTIEQI